MTISLNTQRKEYGVQLTHQDDTFAGDLLYTRSSAQWHFQAPSGAQGPARRTLAAAEYDALAHWEDQE